MSEYDYPDDGEWEELSEEELDEYWDDIGYGWWDLESPDDEVPDSLGWYHG